MQMPIYPSDLQSGRGFKRVAKKIQVNWPGADSLSLSSAQQILSCGLGYRDFHDLQRSVKCDEVSLPHPSQLAIRDRILTSTVAFCQSRKITDVHYDSLRALAMSLPLHELSGFHLADRVCVHPTLSIRGRLAPTQPLISESDLKRIWNVVEASANPRDKCLFVLLFKGARATEIARVKIGDLRRSWYSGDLLTVELEFATNVLRFAIPPRFIEWFDLYLHRTELSDNDYLFPSDIYHLSQPMHPRKVTKLIQPYLQDALIEPSQRFAHVIRHSIMRSSHASEPRSWWAEPPAFDSTGWRPA